MLPGRQFGDHHTASAIRRTAAGARPGRDGRSRRPTPRRGGAAHQRSAGAAASMPKAPPETTLKPASPHVRGQFRGDSSPYRGAGPRPTIATERLARSARSPAPCTTAHRVPGQVVHGIAPVEVGELRRPFGIARDEESGAEAAARASTGSVGILPCPGSRGPACRAGAHPATPLQARTRQRHSATVAVPARPRSSTPAVLHARHARLLPRPARRAAVPSANRRCMLRGAIRPSRSAMGPGQPENPVDARVPRVVPGSPRRRAADAVGQRQPAAPAPGPGTSPLVRQPSSPSLARWRSLAARTRFGHRLVGSAVRSAAARKALRIGVRCWWMSIRSRIGHGTFLGVPADLVGRAAALRACDTVQAAGAGVRRQHQLEARRVGGRGERLPSTIRPDSSGTAARPATGRGIPAPRPGTARRGGPGHRSRDRDPCPSATRLANRGRVVGIG